MCQLWVKRNLEKNSMILDYFFTIFTNYLNSSITSLCHYRFSYSTQGSYLTNKRSSYALVIKSKIKVLILMKGGWIFLTVVNIICNRPQK